MMIFIRLIVSFVINTKACKKIIDYKQHDDGKSSELFYETLIN
jgi:hypothetical protein